MTKAKPTRGPREYTVDEVREMFLDHVRDTVAYWAALPDKTVADRCEGVAFTILAAIDGAALALPGFMLVPNPHPSDRIHHIDNGENFFPEPTYVTACDIAGGLHEQLFQTKR